MVMRLAAALDIPRRQVNSMLEAARHPPAYPDPAEGRSPPKELAGTLELMKQHHDPFPLFVTNRTYDVIDINRGGRALFGAVMPNVSLRGGLNLVRFTFDPAGAYPVLVNIDELGRGVLRRLQREVLADRNDIRLRQLLDEVSAMPTVAQDWREADLTIPPPPVARIILRAGEQELKFMATEFMVLADLGVEAWYPFDPTTEDSCRRWSTH